MYIRESYRFGKEHVIRAKSYVKVTDGVYPDRLRVRVPGTHGGFVNKNGYFYKIDGMKEAYKSWVSPYKKPVLIGHGDNEDPIGRVVAAELVEDDPMDYVNRFGRTDNIPAAHIDMELEITDQESIKKILDGIYLTVSQGADCDDVRCSICDQDIAEEGPCDHKRGKLYDEKLAYWIFGPLNYQELSIVNVPSDEFAILEPVKNTNMENQEVMTFQPPAMDMNCGLEFVTVKDSKEARLVAKETPRFEDWTEEELTLSKQVWKQVDEFLMDGLDEEDKKLTTAARKKLPANVFCAPDRAFPVPDCLHYRVAKSYLNRYKGPGDKKKILACIERRGKLLGCGNGAKKKDELLDQINEFNDVGNDNGDVKLFVKENFVAKDEFVDLNEKFEDVSAKQKESTKEVEAKQAKIEELENQVGEFEEKKKEYESEVNDSLARRIVDIRILFGEYQFTEDDKEEQYKNWSGALSERTKESLTDTLVDLQNKMFSSKLEPIIDPGAHITQRNEPTRIEKPKQFDSNKDFLHYFVFGNKLKKE